MSKINLRGIVKTARAALIKHSPELLTGLGLVAVGSAVYIVAKVTPKALQVIENEVREREEITQETGVAVADLPAMLPLRDKFRLTWKLYLPAAITFATGTACIVGASAVNAKKNAALATACTVAESALIDYAGKVKELVGEEKAKEIHNAAVEEHMQKMEPYAPSSDPNKPELFYDVWASRSFYSTENKISAAVNRLNARVNSYMSASYNELCYEWEQKPSDSGEKWGWNVNTGLVKLLDFVPAFDDEGRPCKGIRLMPPPVHDYARIL